MKVSAPRRLPPRIRRAEFLFGQASVTSMPVWTNTITQKGSIAARGQDQVSIE